ncbi:MAG: ABC transporter ATP-binding protein [Proteobacteria bacterium]|nr:ABC transporter ATP-binding protein [Pseudomonadota bacterium]
MNPSQMQPAITLRNVRKRYGGEDGVLALDGISTDIRDCEFVSLIGPSGCGKSTLLRIISGLTAFEAEEASVFGRRIDGPPDGMGIVFQTANLLPWRTVANNLRLAVDLRAAHPRGSSAADVAARTTAMLARLGLEDFGSRYPHELSGGMKQRVAIGQALLANPRVLLMDEPFGALDALTRDHLNVELLRIWQAERKTVVLVTHSIAEAIFLSDRALVMSARPGRILEDIRIDLPRPRDPRTTRQLPEFGRYVVQLGELMGVM